MAETSYLLDLPLELDPNPRGQRNRLRSPLPRLQFARIVRPTQINQLSSLSLRLRSRFLLDCARQRPNHLQFGPGLVRHGEGKNLDGVSFDSASKSGHGSHRGSLPIQNLVNCLFYKNCKAMEEQGRLFCYGIKDDDHDDDAYGYYVYDSLKTLDLEQLP
uniref:Uncharacterized protein n=1 Tax=Cannabis sativa TaxID=3483 RepID=A0A803P503_CANSA